MSRAGPIALALVLCARLARAEHEDATEREADRLGALVLDRMLTNHARVIAIADRIRISAAPYCGGEVGAVLGVFVANQTTFMEIVPHDGAFETHVQRAATERFALDARLRVLVAPAGLPAAEAGIMRVGDVITRINGRALDRRDHLFALRPSASSTGTGEMAGYAPVDRQHHLAANPGRAKVANGSRFGSRLAKFRGRGWHWSDLLRADPRSCWNPHWRSGRAHRRSTVPAVLQVARQDILQQKGLALLNAIP